MRDAQTRARAREILQRLLDRIPDLKQLQSDSPEFHKWRRDARIVVTNIFGESSRNVKEFDELSYRPGVYGFYPNASQQAYVRDLEKAGAMLKSMIDEMDGAFEL